MRNPNTTPRSRRGNPLKTMGMCKNQVWFGILIFFAVWSLTLLLNYSSLILNVQSLAYLYVYSPVKQQDSIPLRRTRSDKQSTSTPDVVSSQEDDSIMYNDGSSSSAAAISISLGPDDLNSNNRLRAYEKNEEEGSNISTIPNINTPLINATPPPPPHPLPQRRLRGRGKRRGRRGNQKVISDIKPAIIQEAGEDHTTWTRIEMVTPPSPEAPRAPPRASLPISRCNVEVKSSEPKSCVGRYVYVHILPRRYHVDILRDCSRLDRWTDMCPYVKNLGLGPPLPDSDPGWFATNQFLLEVIFHNRMKMYECLTNDSAQATAVFVPFYAGLDVYRNMWNSDSRVRDSSAFELIKWLKRRPEWRRFWGRDHFFIGGRITWDFRRSENGKDPDWGTKLLYLPEARNMTALVIESSPWNNNDFGIPYPTYFHPSNDDQVFSWQARMMSRSRKFLFSFVGAPRPDRPDSIRNQLITQCTQSQRCNMVECNHWKNKCHKPKELMKVFQDSHFCLQPPGDSYTRRSTFDSIISGCIPVFFHPGSAYTQYYWHLPRDYKKYSVFISLYEVRAGNVTVERVLENISTRKVEQMREEVVGLIPRVVYADPRCRLETLNDAFDVAMEGVLERVRRTKEDMRAGRNESFAYDEKQAWKYDWLGRLEEHEWDPYFSI